MEDFTIRPLGPSTWDAFARLVERHNGVWGGCWCTWFHTMAGEKERNADANRSLKQRLVAEGRAHAALVFDGERAVGWCQFGPPDELPNIYHRKEYEAGLRRRPDYRVTCFFVDRDYRRKGVAEAALRGALELDRPGRRWGRRGLPPRPRGGREGVLVAPLQLHARDVRGGRVRLRPCQGR